MLRSPRLTSRIKKVPFYPWSGAEAISRLQIRKNRGGGAGIIISGSCPDSNLDARPRCFWGKHRRAIQIFSAPALVLLIAEVYIIVYITGGIKFVYSHSMYIPILFSGFVFGVKGGVFFGLLGGFVLGMSGLQLQYPLSPDIPQAHPEKPRAEKREHEEIERKRDISRLVDRGMQYIGAVC